MKFVKYLLILAVCCILLGAGSIYGLYRYIEPQLPDVATLKDVRLQIPMQVYSADGELIAQYGEKRRIPVTLDQIPPEMINAFIATEDSRFYEHHGIDPVGIFRAASVALFSGHASQGASTITQQLARNFFLSPERTLMRKIKEAFLAIRIEQMLNKNEILELYLNKIYLGYRAYGVGAAAQVYFGKTVDQLSLSEMAVIAGLPKAPSTFNPLYSMDRAIARRNVVLSRMLSEDISLRRSTIRPVANLSTQIITRRKSPSPHLICRKWCARKCITVMAKAPTKMVIVFTRPSPAKCSRPRNRRCVITCWTMTCATVIAARRMCYGKWAKRRGTVKNYRYVESVADLRTAASRRGHQR